jgi:DNA-directed RNA polymerase specialized sigma24 family protein
MPTPQQKPTKAMAVRREHQDIAAGILAALSARDREVLMRFYCHGQAAGRIQADMGVTETEFRLIKSRAKASFTTGVQQRIEPRAVTRSRNSKRA